MTLMTESSDQPCALYATVRMRTISEIVMTEASLLGKVLHLCDLYGVLAYHTVNPRGSRPGFPDIVAVGPGGVLFRELKVNADLTAAQKDWRRRLLDAGADYEVWTREDYASGHVTSQLARISRLAVIQQLPFDLADAA